MFIYCLKWSPCIYAIYFQSWNSATRKSTSAEIKLIKSLIADTGTSNIGGKLAQLMKCKQISYSGAIKFFWLKYIFYTIQHLWLLRIGFAAAPTSSLCPSWCCAKDKRSWSSFFGLSTSSIWLLSKFQACRAFGTYWASLSKTPNSNLRSDPIYLT